MTTKKKEIARIIKIWRNATSWPGCIKASQKKVVVTKEDDLPDFEKIGTGYSMTALGLSKNYAKG